MQIKRASREDILLLVEHHRRMFAEIFSAMGRETTEAQLQAVDGAYTSKLTAEIPTGHCTAWICEVDDIAAASGAVSLLSMVPLPDDPTCRVAYLHSIYTVSAFRNRGYAQKIVSTVEAYCRARGIKRMVLNASAAGMPMYDAMGFQHVDNAMRKWLV